MSTYKSGYVGIIGKPNVGKSTLLNHLLGQKIAITSPKPQTTRNRIMGVLTGDDYQIVFVDTPGIHHPKDQLHKFMMSEIEQTINDVDLILFLVEPAHNPDPEDLKAMEFLKKSRAPVILIINKIDQSPNYKLPPVFGEEKLFKGILMLSALKGTGCDELLQKIISLLPLGPQFFPDDTLTDRTERFIIAELIREKVYEFCKQEIPYSVAVVTEEVIERTTNKDYVKAVIYVEKDSQKGILIGNKGQMLKTLGQAIRPEIENLLQKNVYLELLVKVRKNWRKDQAALKEFGLEGN